jgi:hypothetical protein
VPQPQEPGGQRVASGAFEDGAQAPPEGTEPWTIRLRFRRRDDLAREGLCALLVTGREREDGQRWATVSANLASAATSTPGDWTASPPVG